MIPLPPKPLAKPQPRGIGTPDYNGRSTVAGQNSSSPLVPLNQPAGSIYPGGQPGTGFQPNYKPGNKTLTLSLATTITNKVFVMSGNIIWCVDSTNSTDRVLVRIDGGLNDNNDPIPFGPGLAIQGWSFSQFSVTIPTAIAGATMSIVVINDPQEFLEVLNTRA